jgi:hypothetical protein
VTAVGATLEFRREGGRRKANDKSAELWWAWLKFTKISAAAKWTTVSELDVLCRILCLLLLI